MKKLLYNILGIFCWSAMLCIAIYLFLFNFNNPQYTEMMMLKEFWLESVWCFALGIAGTALLNMGEKGD